MADAAKIDIKSLLFNQLQEELRQQEGSSYRAGQIMGWLYAKRVESFEKMTDLPRERCAGTHYSRDHACIADRLLHKSRRIFGVESTGRL